MSVNSKHCDILNGLEEKKNHWNILPHFKKRKITNVQIISRLFSFRRNHPTFVVYNDCWNMMREERWSFQLNLFIGWTKKRNTKQFNSIYTMLGSCIQSFVFFQLFLTNASFSHLPSQTNAKWGDKNQK